MPGQALACKSLRFNAFYMTQVPHFQRFAHVKKNLLCITRPRKSLLFNALRMHAQMLAHKRLTPHPFECGVSVNC